MKFLILALFVSLIGVASPVAAASFDCAKAQKSIEKLICSDSGLSRSDDDLQKTYKQALGRLSNDGQATLRKSQISWLRYVATVDGIFEERVKQYLNKNFDPNGIDALIGDTCPNASPDKRSRVACLKSLYTDRIQFLSSPVEKQGEFGIWLVRFYYAGPSGDDSDDAAPAGVSVSTFTFPQIESPPGVNARQINSLLYLKGDGPTCGLPGYTASSTEDITHIGDQVITAKLNLEYGCGHALEDFFDQDEPLTIIIKPKPHLLSADDLFKRDAPWKKALLDNYVSIGRTEGMDIGRKDMSDIEKNASDPESWMISRDSLTIKPSFDFNLAHKNDGDDQSDKNMQDVIIPWDKLKPYLAVDPATFFQ